MATVHRHEPSIYYYTFAPHEPALRIHSGDRVIVQTVDAGHWDSNGEQLAEELRQSRADTEFRQSNPQVGPYYVEEAEVGDVLRVHIRRVDLNRSWAFSRFNPGFGNLGVEDYPGGPTGLNEPLPQKYYHWELDHAKSHGNAGTARKQTRQHHYSLSTLPRLYRRGSALRRAHQHTFIRQPRRQYGLRRDAARYDGLPAGVR